MRFFNKLSLIFSVLVALVFGWSSVFLAFSAGQMALSHTESFVSERSLASVGLWRFNNSQVSEPDWEMILPLINKFIGTDNRNYNQSVKLYFVGDIMLDRGVRRSVINNGQGDYNFIFQNLDWLREGDIVFGNLEGPASDQGRDLGSLYSFRMDPSVISVLRDYGFNVLSLANNHAGDWGREAFVDTIERLQTAGIKHPGGHFNQTLAETPAVIRIDGVDYGFLAFSDVGPAWLRVQSEAPGILLASDSRLETIIRNATSKVDVLIVSFHFGEEYESLPNARQQALARQAVDAGAKIVVGHHPHVIQPVEVYNGGLIAYSLGNFIFDQYFSPETMEGLVLEVNMIGDQIIDWQTKKTKQDSQFVPKLEIKEKAPVENEGGEG